MIDRNLLTQRAFFFALIPELRIRAPIHEKDRRLPHRRPKDTEVLTPTQLWNMPSISMLRLPEVRPHRLLELGGFVFGIDGEWECAGGFEGGFRDGIAGDAFGFDDAFDALFDFFACFGVDAADVDGEAGVVYDYVFGVAGLDAGDCYLGCVLDGVLWL